MENPSSKPLGLINRFDLQTSPQLPVGPMFRDVPGYMVQFTLKTNDSVKSLAHGDLTNVDPKCGYTFRILMIRPNGTMVVLTKSSTAQHSTPEDISNVCIGDTLTVDGVGTEPGLHTFKLQVASVGVGPAFLSRASMTLLHFSDALGDGQRIIFNANDMNKFASEVPDSFFAVYDTFVAINAWNMAPSGDASARPITLSWKVASNFDGVTNPVLSMILLIAKNVITSGDKARVRVRVDVKGNGEIVPASGPFVVTVNTGDLIVTEPTVMGNLRVLLGTVVIDASAVDPNDLVTMVFDRVAPSADEYDKDLFLKSIDIAVATT